MFKYRKLSEEKCKQLNSIEFSDPEQGGPVDFTKLNITVISDDDYYCLFRFFPNHEFIRLQKYSTYVLFYGDNYVVASVNIEEGHEKIVNSVRHRTKIIEIKKSEFFDKNVELLQVLKAALIESHQNHYHNPKIEVFCTVIYDGMEI